MKSAIWKFHVEYGVNIVRMPAGPHVTLFQEQEGKLCFWAEVVPGIEVEEEFHVIHTGEEYTRGDMEVVGSTVAASGLVCHLLRRFQ